MSLGVLVSLDQQLHQAGDDSSLLQWGVVGRTQGQVADQPDGSLEGEEEEEGGICLGCGLEQHVSPKSPTGWSPPHLSHPIPSGAGWLSFPPPWIHPLSRLSFDSSISCCQGVTQQEQGCGSSSSHHHSVHC